MLLSMAALSAQPHRSEAAVRALMEDPSRAGNNTNSYEFHEIRDTKPPKGYKPFYISHYGRHGSRSSGDGHEYVRLRDILLAAQADGQLTEKGNGC